MTEPNTPARRLAGPVTVGARTYQPGDDLPPDVVAQIRNPKVWAVDDAAAAEAAKPKTGGTTSGARLATRVTVGGKMFSPDDPLPDDVAAQIRNPKVWEGGQLPDLTGGAAGKDAETAPDTGTDTPTTVETVEDVDGPAAEPAGDSEPQKGRRAGSRRA